MMQLVEAGDVLDRQVGRARAAAVQSYSTSQHS